MLTFKQYLILLEDRIDFLKNQYKNRINTNHDTLAKHHDSDAVIDHFSQNADPSTNKQHTDWILRQYNKGKIRQEDHPRIRETLSNFDRYKSKLDKKDINQYKSLGELEDSVEPHLGKVASTGEQTRIDKSGAEKLHDENGFKVYHLKTKEAACHYGKGTKWCTAADKDNMFDHYNKSGPLYYIEGKDNDGQTKKFQFHFDSEQFMDDKDEEINADEFIKNNPEIKNVDEFKGLHPRFPLDQPTKERFIKKLDSGKIERDDILRAVENGYLSKEHISNIINDPNDTRSHERLANGHNFNKLHLTPEHINTIVNNPNSNDAHKSLIFGHNLERLKLSPENINTIVNNPNSNNAHSSMISNRFNLSPEHINTIVNNPNSNDAHYNLISEYKTGQLHLSPENINTIVNNPNSTWAHEHLVDFELMSDNNPYKRFKLSANHISAIANNSKSTIAKNKLVDAHFNGKLQLTPDHIDAIIKDPNAFWAHKKLSFNHTTGKLKLTPEQLNTINSHKY